MIKTDGVIYRIKTLKEYNWLMQELDEAGCVWIDGEFPTEANLFHINMPNIYIFMNNKELTYRERKRKETTFYPIIAWSASMCQN